MNAGALSITAQALRMDGHGRYSLNDLHRLAGGEVRHQPSNWLRTQQAQELIAEYEAEPVAGEVMDGSSNLRNAAIVTSRQQGTFAAKELCIAFAAWVSPAFHLRVIRAFDATTRPHALPGPDVRQLERQAEQLEVVSAEVLMLAPKARAFDVLGQHNGALSLTEAAKAMNIQRKEFIDWLADQKWIYRNGSGGDWQAYSARIESGYMIHRAKDVEHAPGFVRQHLQPMITAKGLARLAADWSGAGT